MLRQPEEEQEHMAADVPPSSHDVAQTRVGTRRSVIPTTHIQRGVQVELRRTLPFWRCWLDQRFTHTHSPVIMSVDCHIAHRLPCTYFHGVDVVWAISRAHLRTQSGALTSTIEKRGRSSSSSSSSSPTTKYKHPTQADRGTPRYWRGRPHVDEHVSLGTMHFVHHDAHRPESSGSEHSFHIQSVLCYEHPGVLQCVAGTMVAYAFIIFTSLELLAAQMENPQGVADDLAVLSSSSASSTSSGDASEEEEEQRQQHPSSSSSSTPTIVLDERGSFASHASRAGEPTQRLLRYFPPPTCRVLILGMGGNSMAVALRHILGPDAILHIVEIDAAVVEVCRVAGTLLDDDANVFVHVMPAEELLRDANTAHNFDFVFMDLFEPLQGNMLNCPPTVLASFAALRDGGLLIINDHQEPSEERLRTFLSLYPTNNANDGVGVLRGGNIQAVNLHGWNESVIVCAKPRSAAVDQLSMKCTRTLATQVAEMYHAVLPGWMPNNEWIQKIDTLRKNGAQYRVWRS